MGKITVRPLKTGECMEMLPRMFSILHENMHAIAPTGNSYEEDREYWIGHIQPALEEEETRIVLIFVSGCFAGYFQYAIDKDRLLVEEVEISPRYQRTMVFYRLCCWLADYLPEEIQWVESYVRKENKNSLGIQQKLGMKIIGENKSGTSYHMGGEAAQIRQWFIRKK